LKILRAFILADTLLLAALGLGRAFIHPGSLPVVYLEAEVSQSTASLGFAAAGLGALALVLWMSTDLPLVADRRRLALGLSVTNLLIAVLAFFQQTAVWGSVLGVYLINLFLALAIGLAWVGLRPLKPDEIAAEIEGLRIPEEIRQGLLRQIGEAAAQEERNRLARDLHDSIKQQLFSINVGAATTQERWERDPEGARKALADVRRSAREAMVEMQAMLHQLRPEALGTAGLIEALREQCEALGYRSGAEVTVEFGEPVPDDRMPPGAPETLFRMAQEMLANVARHARARRVRLWLGRQDEAMLLHVEDDGQGFSSETEVPGMGLRNLKERAESLRGHFEIASAPGAGTRIQVWVPLTPLPIPVDRSLARDIHRERRRLVPAAAIIPLFLISVSAGPRSASFFQGAAMTYLLLKAVGSGIQIHEALRGSRGAAPADAALLQYLGRRNRAVLFLAEAYAASEMSREVLTGGWRVFWAAASVLCLLLTGMEVVNACRRSRPREWPYAPSFLNTALVAGLPLLGLGAARLWQLGPARGLFLVIAAAIAACFLWRQPRMEGVPS
jgi:signal transduction histidine kinase